MVEYDRFADFGARQVLERDLARAVAPYEAVRAKYHNPATVQRYEALRQQAQKVGVKSGNIFTRKDHPLLGRDPGALPRPWWEWVPGGGGIFGSEYAYPTTHQGFLAVMDLLPAPVETHVNDRLKATFTRGLKHQ
jgi:hypothetical protein